MIHYERKLKEEIAPQFRKAQKKGENAKKRPFFNHASRQLINDQTGELWTEGAERASGGPSEDRLFIIIRCVMDNNTRWSASGAGNGGFQRSQVREDERGV